MGEITSVEESGRFIEDAKNRHKKIVLVGGCFDILHFGHIKFLEEARKKGDYLVVFLESDERVNKLKGENRPLFEQKERAAVLSALNSVDLVILLPFIKTDDGYDRIIEKIRPEIIAITEYDSYEKTKRKQANKTGSLFEVIPFVKTYSSSKLAKMLGIE